jgi:aryl-alcohol dehydrogenase-like predicted oxidoreductase
VALIQRALELGVNTFDTAHIYADGESERRLGQALRGTSQPVFVSTKITDRTRDGARRQMDTSLQRLGMDRVDLMFVHGLDDEEDYPMGDSLQDRSVLSVVCVPHICHHFWNALLWFLAQ